MDGTRFDELTKRFSAGLSRRQVLRGLAGGAGAITVAAVFEDHAGAQACDPNADTVTCPAGSFHEGLTKKPDGGCCNGNGNCCSNICEENICVAGTPPECVPEDVECSQVVECCEGLFCAEISGAGEFCVSCVPAGGDCSESDCCDGLTCFEGLCVIEECLEEGADCAPGECCEGLVCFEGLCLPCSGDGEFCEISDDCCGTLICVDSYCAPQDDCIPISQICEDSAECCDDLLCINYVCAYKLPNTGVADGSSGTSGLLTTAIAGGAAALVAAKVLRHKPASDTPSEG